MVREARAQTIFEVIVIGSGFAGIGIAIQMLKAKIDDFVILESAKEIGGTWRENTYPGCACDVPAHLYSYSFEPNPDWTRAFAPQAEIKAYLERCVDKYGVRPKIRFESNVVGAAFDEDAGMWTVDLADGSKLRARSVISATGLGLSNAIFPDIEGREKFRGKSMHSSRWDHEYSLEGKSVAVIGTGASAIQIVPSIAERVGHMDVYQRTAPWIQTRPDRHIPENARDFFREHPMVQGAIRGALYGFLESLAVGFVIDPRLNIWREGVCTRFMESQVSDLELRKKLLPSYRLGCKRVLVSTDYYPALMRENVDLVTDRIQSIDEDSIVTADGARRKVDAIIYATGFEAAEATLRFSVKGRGGRELADAWKDGSEAYAGTTVSGFPNMFFIIGPNTGLGHNSMIYMMESQFPYVLDALRLMRKKNLRMIDVKKNVQNTYNTDIQRRLAKSVWSSGGCQSWYLMKNGKNTTLWPGFTFEYRWKMRKFDHDNYELLESRRGDEKSDAHAVMAAASKSTGSARTESILRTSETPRAI